MTSLPKNIKKYFDKYGINNYSLQPDVKTRYEYIIVIPAIKESENIPVLLHSLNEQESKYFNRVLVVIVVNNIVSASPDIKDDNSGLMKYLDVVIEEKRFGNLNLAYVDASSQGNEMSDKEGGVGVARKTGMDTALRYFDYSSGKFQILGCLDADCIVERNYFDAVIDYYKATGAEAGYVNYFHPMPDDIENKKAILCYELFLRFYVFGLVYAESPYAFHTIGSTMNSTADAYSKIGGMNKRKAAEDFYFMEKLGKVTAIHKIDSTAIYPSGRGSFRVPFGTGQRVNRYLAGTHEEYYIYNIKSFGILKEWVKLFHSEKMLAAEDYLEKAEEIDSGLKDFLIEQNFAASLEKIQNNSPGTRQLSLQKKLWFDGFRTLKLIHYLRDNGYPNQPMFPHLAENLSDESGVLPFEYSGEFIPDIETQVKFLELLRVKV